MSFIHLETEFEKFNKEAFFNLIDPSQISRLLRGKIEVKNLSLAPHISEGAEYSYTMTRFGLSQDVKFKVQKYIPGVEFQYKQIQGLFTQWIHHMTWKEVDGKCYFIEEVRYQLPGGVLGYLINDLFLREDLKTILSHRCEQFKRTES